MNQKFKWGVIGGVVGFIVLIIILFMCCCGGTTIDWGMNMNEVSEEMKDEGYEFIKTDSDKTTGYVCYDEELGSFTVTCTFNQRGELYRVDASGFDIPYQQFLEYVEDEYDGYDIYYSAQIGNTFYGISDNDEEVGVITTNNDATWFNFDYAPAAEKTLFAQQLAQMKQKAVD